MFGLHMPELIIILVVALLIFGPKRLPEMGSGVGKFIREFRKGVNDLSHPKEEHDDIKNATLEAIERENASRKARYDFQKSNVNLDAEMASTTTSSEATETESKLD